MTEKPMTRQEFLRDLSMKKTGHSLDVKCSRRKYSGCQDIYTHARNLLAPELSQSTVHS